ncbi:hypothetical protein PG997_002385 [Apiospora hydei]|uniref:SNF2 N-terminal domain-containing protein n=1 Tax=Apiospora hydei TaxID=1337664 RepID=A0ABR1X9C2_9PEZI
MFPSPAYLLWRERVRVKGNNPFTFYYNVCTKEAQKNRPDAVRGGILAYEMDLGKTVILISFIVSDKVANTGGSARPTLVVTPAVLLDQWRDQANLHVAKQPRTDNSVLKVRLYRDSNRCRDPDVIQQDDIVIVVLFLYAFHVAPMLMMVTPVSTTGNGTRLLGSGIGVGHSRISEQEVFKNGIQDSAVCRDLVTKQKQLKFAQWTLISGQVQSI